jgi:FAD/FMN-containing dehydrogenase
VLSIVAKWWIAPGCEQDAVADANYIDPLLADWPKQYYGQNYARLEHIKQAVDPHDIFGFQQGIGSLFRPGTAVPLDLSPLNRSQIP